MSSVSLSIMEFLFSFNFLNFNLSLRFFRSDEKYGNAVCVERAIRCGLCTIVPLLLLMAGRLRLQRRESLRSLSVRPSLVAANTDKPRPAPTSLRHTGKYSHRSGQQQRQR